MLADTDRSIGLAYGACKSANDQFARRIAYLIDENGLILQAHEKIDPRSYPAEQLAKI